MSGLSDRCGTHTGLLTCNHLQPTSGETLRHPHPDNGLETGQAEKQESLPPKRSISLHPLSRCSGQESDPRAWFLSLSDRRQAPSSYLAVSQSPVAKLPSWPETDQKYRRDSDRDQKSYPTSLVWIVDQWGLDGYSEKDNEYQWQVLTSILWAELTPTCLVSLAFSFLRCRSVTSRDQLFGLQHARLPCPSPSPGVCSNSCPLSRWCHPIISSSVAPFSSCPQPFPASEAFPMSRLFASGGQVIGASASAAVLPVKIQGWFPLGVTGLINYK